jgi:hypothetical protein
LKRERLLKYCEENQIFVPSGATIEYLNAAIVRASLHRTGVTLQDGASCFGFWEHEDMTCATCDFEKQCSKASLGIDKEELLKKLDAAENPKLRFDKVSKLKKFTF